MKVIGAVLMILGAAASGLSSVFRLRKKAAYLSGITVSLGMMKNEICTSLRPMGDVLEELAARAPDRTRSLYAEVYRSMSKVGETPFCEIWKEAVERECENILSRNEKEELCALGISLGRYDIQWQAEAIDRAIKRFEHFTTEAETIRDRDSKAHAFLGLAAGVFAVIVLV